MPENTAVVATQRSKFVELLRSVGDGSLEDELSDIVVHLVDKMRTMGDNNGGKPAGAIVVKIKMKYDRGVFDVDADVKTTEPQTIRPRTLMYAIPGGGLSRNNPQQMDAFRELPPAPVRETRELSIANR